MIKGDICTSPVDFALQEAMKQVENAKEDHDLAIYEALKRSRKMWERIRIHEMLCTL